MVGSSSRGDPGSESASGPVRVGALIGVVLTPLGTATSMTVLWLSMRAVLALGGFVASGGPYVIAHQAPTWVWLLPVSIVLLIVCMFASQELNSSFETPSLMLVAWSMLFLSLGWNFLEFGLHPPGGGGLSVGWLVSAAAFFATGGGGLYALSQAVQVNREFDRNKEERTGVPSRPGFAVYLGATVLAIAAGILLGVLVFNIAVR